MKKYHQYKFLSLAGLIVIFFLSSCVKNRSGETDFGGLKPVVLIPEGGLATFANQSLTFPGSDASDTTTFHVNFAATNVSPTDETIGIGVDQAAMATYNSTSDIKYNLFPDSIYSFKTTSVTIKKGNNYTDAIPLVVYPSKIDPTQNYMLPISVKTVPNGATISGNYGTIYYHLIGNPIAGAYTHEWIRWNNATGTGTPGYDQTSSDVFAPNSPTEIAAPSGSAGLIYILDFQNNGGVLSNFTVSFDAKSVANSGVTITAGPVLVLADPVNKKFTFQFNYNNAAGSPRYIIDKFWK